MTDNKPKIDLKSRLGKKTVSSPSGASIPPPVGMPRPSGIPAPPFASRPAPTPSIGASNPYASVESVSAPAPRIIEPQAIKIEMSDEVRHEQKKQRKKFIIGAIFTAFIGGVLGFAIGSGHERGKVADQAIRDAGDLGKQIQDAMGVGETLADTLKAAREQLKNGKYPDAEVKKLGELRIPFGGDKLGGRNIGRFKKEVASGLLGLASQAEKVNDQIDTVQRLLGGARKSLEENFAQASSPKVTWAAIAESAQPGAMLTMLRVTEPFTVKTDKDKSWPESLKFKVDGRDATLKRYVKGAPVSDPAVFIPVDPTSQSAVCPDNLLFRVARPLEDLEGLLRGGKDATGEEETGMMEAGHALVEKLKAIGVPG